MPQCGHCEKPVAASDITCPHCGVLLAAYASPTGSVAPIEQKPGEADPIVVPDVDLDVPPPSETPVVTNPEEVAEEAISTAPRPLFDTYLTVEEIARAAESDHGDNVVVIPDNKDIATKKVEFEVPDYAKPPADSAPIPTIDEDDNSVPLITHDTATPQQESASKPEPASIGPEPPEDLPPAKLEPKPSDDVPPTNSGPKPPDNVPPTNQGPEPPDDAPPAQTKPTPAPPAPKQKQEPEPTIDSASETWLYSSVPASSIRAAQPQRTSTAAPSTPKPESASESGPVGQTDAYLRKLHNRVGYEPSQGSISKPVEQRHVSARERKQNRRSALSVSSETPEMIQSDSMQMGCSALYFILLAVMWFSTVATVVTGTFSPFLIFFTFALTWGIAPIRRLIREVSNS